MPLLPWKIARASRISQIVADLHSPKRGASLVVETGFPTSIVDLFVKHRDRLRKNSARKKSKKKKRSKNELHDSIALLPCSTPEIDSTASGGGGNLEIQDWKVLEEARVVGDGCDLVRNRIETETETCVVGGGGGAAGGNGVCLAVLKMFVVAVFALSTKKLVVGFTLSAFLLLLLDVVGKRAVRFLRPPCSLIHKVSNHLWIGKDDLVIQHSTNYERESVAKVSIDPFLNESTDSPELSSPIEEIQLVEPEVDAAETPKVTGDEKNHLDFLEEEIENKDGASRRGKRNRRMFEKLVRRKSGGQAIQKKKNDDNNNKREELDFRSDRFDKASVEEDDETLEQDQQEPPGFDEQCQAMEVAAEIERDGSSLRYPILVLIVLAGLIGGRSLALVLITGCSFMIKLKEMARRRLQNPPLKKVSCF